MADPMVDGIHFIPSPPIRPMHSPDDELKELVKSLADTVAKLSTISASTAGSVSDFLDVFKKSTTKEQNLTDRLEEAYKKDEQIKKIDQTLRVLNESIHLNEDMLKLLKQNTQKMTDATNALAMDRDRYKERTEVSKQNIQEQRQYANKTLLGDLGRFVVKNLLGTQVSEILGDWGQHKQTQQGDISALKSMGRKRINEVRDLQLQRQLLGENDSTDLENDRWLKEKKEMERLQRKKELFEQFLNMSPPEREKPIFSGAPTGPSPLGLPPPQRLLTEPNVIQPPMNDLGRDLGTIYGRSPGPYRDSKGRFARLPLGIDTDTHVSQTHSLLDAPAGYSNQYLLKAFTKKSGLHPTANDVSENSPAAFSTGFLYLGDILKKTEEEAQQNADDLKNATEASGGKGLGGLMAGALGAEAISAIGAAIPGILAVALPALGIAAGVAGLALLVSSAIKDTEARGKERDAEISSLSPKELADLSAKGIVPTKGSGMVETATAQVALAKGTAANVDISGYNSSSIMGTGSQSEINTYKAVVEAKNAKSQTDAKTVGNPFDGKTHFWWQTDKDGKYWYSPSESMTPKAYLMPGDFSDMQKSNLFMFSGYNRDGKHLDDTSLEQMQPGAGFDSLLNKSKGKPVKFHTGGIVPGPQGVEQDAKVLGGEVFINPPESKAFASNLQKIVSSLSEASSAKEAGSFSDNTELIEHLKKNEELLSQLLMEMKKNTEVTEKKELKVETPRSMPIPSRQYQRIG